MNLGGWLLLEKWMTPSLFDGLEATDEYSFCVDDSKNNYKKLRKHREQYIKKSDFKWLADNAIDIVRLPIGYWAFHNDSPYLNCQKQIDDAFEWASEYGLSIILDLHGAPGSQNGLDHSGRSGEVKWTRRSNVKSTLEFLSDLSYRYGSNPFLWGINLLNEPNWNIPLKLLRSFYKKGYKKVRKHCGDSVAVIISDTFRPVAWNGFMSKPRFKNVVLDMHLYQCFGESDKKLDLEGHLEKTRTEWSNIIGQSDKPVMIGEWSLGLDPHTFVAMTKLQKEHAIRSYADAQLEVFNKATIWCFWNYKTENMNGWDFRKLVESGVIHQ